jgi:hypothetical protein
MIIPVKENSNKALLILNPGSGLPVLNHFQKPIPSQLLTKTLTVMIYL